MFHIQELTISGFNVYRSVFIFIYFFQLGKPEKKVLFTPPPFLVAGSLTKNFAASLILVDVY